MRKVLRITTVLALVVIAFPASASHYVGCAHRPADWTGTSANECASDGQGLNNAWTMNGGNDTAHGDSGFDIINGNGGNDDIRGGPGPDFIAGGINDDSMYEKEPGDVGAGNDDDRVLGDDGDDYVECGRGNDICRGGAGFDTLFHCHDGAADDITGFEQHFDVTDPDC